MSDDQMTSRMSRHGNDSKKSSSGPSKSVKKNKKPKKKKTMGGIILRIFIGLFLIACVAFIAGVGVFWYYAKDAPELSFDKLDDTVSSKIYDNQGNLLQDLGANKREKFSADEMPQVLIDAIVSVEDRRFYNHPGVDPIRIAGALVSNVSGSSSGLQGGSTLTQQLIKLSFFSTDVSDQTLARKIQEAWMAYQLEQQISKQEIITYYSNKVFMSNNYYGMKTAAKKYYGEDALNNLTIAQAATLAGIPQAPSDYNPYLNPEGTKERRDIVLLTMKNNEKITEAEYQQAVATPVEEGLLPMESTTPEDVHKQKVIDPYLKQVIIETEEKYNKNVYTDGLEIHTNLDYAAQEKLYDMVNTDEYVAFPDDEMQVGATVVDVNTGNVVAQIGGRHIAEDVTYGLNLAVNTGRDFGSTVKPITDYAPAIEFLNYSTGKIIRDEPFKFKSSGFDVNNDDRSYLYDITMRTALYYSRNVPAAKLFEEVGKDQVSGFLRGLGIEYSQIQDANAYSSNTAVQDDTKYGASSEKMAAAYAAFANGGTYYKPSYISEIVYQDGSRSVNPDTGTKAMEETTAYMITDMLKDVFTLGTGAQAQIWNLNHAGKTGTSNYTEDELANLTVPYAYGAVPDSNFVGYTKYYSLAIWTGYNDKQHPILSNGQNVAMHLYREYMEYLSENTENEDWEMPNGLTQIRGELYLKGYENQGNYSPSSSVSSSTTETSETDSSETTSESTTTEEPSSSSGGSSSSSSTTEPSSSEEPVPEPTPDPEPEPEPVPEPIIE